MAIKIENRLDRPLYIANTAEPAPIVKIEENATQTLPEHFLSISIGYTESVLVIYNAPGEITETESIPKH